MRRRFAISFTVLVLMVLGSPAPASGLPRPKEQWIEVRTENFTLYSDASPRLTRRVGLNLERLRAALSVLSAMEVRSPLPSYIFVFRNTRSYERYVDHEGTVGLFTTDHTGNYVAINADPGLNPFEIVYHEYIHYYLHNNSSSPLPTWFDEGMAEYYSTFEVHDNEVEIGRPVAGHATWLLQNEMLPLEQLFAITPQSPVYNEGDQRGVFYAQSWALVHYLISGHRSAQMVQFLELLDGGLGLDAALENAFEISYRALLKELHAYIRKDAYPFIRYKFTELSVDGTTTVTPMEREDVLRRLGDYLSRQGLRRASDADAHFRAALELQPDHAGALAGLAYVRELQGEPDKAAVLYEASLEQDPDNFLTQLLLGMNLMAQHYEATGSLVEIGAQLPPLLASARRHLRRSLELNPGLATAYANFGFTYIGDPGDLEPGIRALEKAASMMPRSVDTAFNLFTLYLRAGERERADALVASVLSRTNDPEIPDLVREALLQDDLARAERLFREDQIDAAVQIMTRVRLETADPALREHLDATLAQIDHTGRLQVAFDLAKAGRLAEAEHQLAAILDELEDSEQRRYAEELLQKIREMRDGP